MKKYSLSEETKKNMSRSKIESHISKMSQSSINLEKVDKDFVVPSSRKNKRFSSIEEYKDFIKVNKWSDKDFSKNGYNKHQVSFFNFILSGKLKLDRVTFENEYKNNLMPLADIEKKYGVPCGLIVFLREYYGIKRIGATGLKRRSEEIDLTQAQIEIIYGTLMGDSCRLGNGIKFKQSVIHKDYIYHLYEIFKNHCVENSVKEQDYFDKRYDKTYKTFSFYTRNHRQIKAICDKFYVNNQKRISEDILNNLSIRSIAYWFMDDGCSDINRNGRTKEKINLGACRLYTCSFSYDENLMIQKFFKEKFGLFCEIRFKCDNGKNPYLVFLTKDANLFREMISEYIIDCFLYKTDFEENQNRILI